MSAILKKESPNNQGDSQDDSTARITGFVGELANTMTSAIEEINDINADTQLLALNARIEAARAGQSGAAFSVVAAEMQALGAKTSEIANDLANRTRTSIDELIEVIGSSVRGGRLSDMALTSIDLIDRNLYERTCDVRWWATDSSLVDALTNSTPEAVKHASKRMGVILNAYTVYHDLVLCDLEGNIIANGRPGNYNSTGKSVSQAEWFQSAASSRSGDEYGFESAHRSPLVNNQSVLVYSCGVREGGSSTGRLLGVLGILFNWEDFAQQIVNSTPLSESERATTRCCICDSQGNLVADSWGKQLDESLRLPEQAMIFAKKKSHQMAKVDGKNQCIAHAQAPGFETYSTGWHAVILQAIED